VLITVATSAASSASAQTFTFTTFQRYIDSYREQFGIPGLSWAIVQGGEVVTVQGGSGGSGKQDVEANIAANDQTPYFIGNLSQIFGSTLLLEKCYDQDTLELGDQVTRWVPDYPDQATTVGQLLTHQSSAGTYVYDPTRFADLTAVVEECADLPYRHVLAGEIFDRLGMTRSVPGRALDGVLNPGRASFTAAELARYNDVIGQMARNYRTDRGVPARTTAPLLGADASNGAISTVLDLAKFDTAQRLPGLLSREALTVMWTQAGGPSPMPTGLGWFVQNYKSASGNEPLLWQFDFTRDVSSSLIIKLPARDLTFIVLANSDGLARTANLAAGDALASPWAKLFLLFFAP